MKSRNLRGAAAATSDNCGGAVKAKTKLALAGLDESHREEKQPAGREREPQHSSRGSATMLFTIEKTSDH